MPPVPAAPVATPRERADPTRGLVAAGDAAVRRTLQDSLNALGYQSCAASSGRQAVDLCHIAGPELVVLDAGLSDPGGTALTTELCADKPIPVVVVSDPGDAAADWCAGDERVVAHLVRPVGSADLGVALAVATRLFARLRSTREEVAELRRSLDDRKTVERAKGLVMRYTGLGEAVAYTRLRRLATDTNRKLIDVALSVLAAGEVFRHLEVAEDAGGGGRQRTGYGTLAGRTGDPRGSGTETL